MIPAIPYMNRVREFARRRGLFFFTVRDQMIARRLYERYAALKN